MSAADDARSGYTRRRFLTLGITSGASASLLLSRNSAARDKPPPLKPTTYNGSTDPYPIPWLDHLHVFAMDQRNVFSKAAAKMNDRGYSLRSGALTRTREQVAPRRWHHKIPQTRHGYKAHGEQV